MEFDFDFVATNFEILGKRRSKRKRNKTTESCLQNSEKKVIFN